MLRRTQIGSVVPRPFLNPGCPGLIFIYVLPRKLLAVDKRETPLELLQIVRLFFFAMVTIRLFFQSDGTVSLFLIFNKSCSSATRDLKQLGRERH